MGEDEGREQVAAPVLIPEKSVTQGLGSGLSLFHRERLGPEMCGSRGHSGALQLLQGSSAVWLKGPRVPAHRINH